MKKDYAPVFMEAQSFGQFKKAEDGYEKEVTGKVPAKKASRKAAPK